MISPPKEQDAAPLPNAVELGKRLYALRVAKGLTLNEAIAQFAKGSPVDRWHSWEQGNAAARDDLAALESVLAAMTESYRASREKQTYPSEPLDHKRAEFESGVKRVAVERFGYSAGDAMLKTILERNLNGRYAVDWVRGAWEGFNMAQPQTVVGKSEPCQK